MAASGSSERGLRVTVQRRVLDGAFSGGGLMQTEMACEAPLMRAESAIAGVLGGGGTLQLEAADVLVLTTPSGDTLRFRGEPTADTRFGTPGERVFFEVASQRVACHHAMMPDYQCLHIREVRYDDNGIVTGHGEWEFLYQDIEGSPGVSGACARATGPTILRA